jgi:two-component system NtrC family sensor kinase
MSKNNKDLIEKNVERKIIRYKKKISFDTLSEENKELATQLLSLFSDTLTQEKKDREIQTLHVAAMNKELEEHIQLLNENNLKMSHQSRLAGIGEMAANLSHEINNPLMGINLLVEKIKLINNQNLSCEEKTEKTMKACQDIGKVVEKISVIIRGLSRISNQNEDTPTKIHCFKKLYQDTESFCLETLKNKRIKYSAKTIKDDIKINVQEVQFSQVILNLLTNAQQAVKELEEKERWINMDYSVDNQELKVIISNGGPKIKETIQDRIFEPFFTTKQVGEGTGLGLQLCKKIIEDFGGSISLDKTASNPTFILTIPIFKS